MDYTITYSKGYIRFDASHMLLIVDSDAAYLVLPKSRSRTAGYFRLAIKSENRCQYKDNDTILIKCHTLRHVIASATTDKTKCIFHNAKTFVLPTHHNLNVIGYT